MKGVLLLVAVLLILATAVLAGVGAYWIVAMEVCDTSLELMKRDNDVCFLRQHGIEAAPGITVGAARREVRKILDRQEAQERPFVNATRPAEDGKRGAK